MGEVMESEASIRHAVRLLPRAPASLWWRPRPWPDTYLLLCDPSHCHLGYSYRLQTVSVFVYTGLRMDTSAGQNASAHVNIWMSSCMIPWVFFFFLFWWPGKITLPSFIAVFHPTCLIPPSCLLLALWIVHWLVFPCDLGDNVFKINGHFCSLCGRCWKNIQYITFCFFLTVV